MARHPGNFQERERVKGMPENIVTCMTAGCENENVPVTIGDWDGSQIACGPCGTVLEAQADWYEPPESDDTDDPVETAAQALAKLTAEERAALIALLTLPDEEETQ